MSDGLDNLSLKEKSTNSGSSDQDNISQTPSCYAAMCDRDAIAEVLVKQNADTDAKGQ